MTVKAQVLVPERFVAVQVTRLVPIGKACGEEMVNPPSVQATTGTGTPETLAGKVTSAEHWPRSLVIAMGGQASTGGELI